MASRSTYRKFGNHGSNIMYTGGIRSINESTNASLANNTIYFAWLGNPRTTVTSCDVKFWCVTAGATVTSIDFYIGRGSPSLGCQTDIEIIGYQDIRSLVATASGGSAGLKTVRISGFTATPNDTLWFGWHQVGTGLPVIRGTLADDLTDGTVLTGASTNTVSFTSASVTKWIHTVVAGSIPIFALVNFYTQ